MLRSLSVDSLFSEGSEFDNFDNPSNAGAPAGFKHAAPLRRARLRPTDTVFWELPGWTGLKDRLYKWEHNVEEKVYAAGEAVEEGVYAAGEAVVEGFSAARGAVQDGIHRAEVAVDEKLYAQADSLGEALAASITEGISKKLLKEPPGYRYRKEDSSPAGRGRADPGSDPFRRSFFSRSRSSCISPDVLPKYCPPRRNFYT